jgi:peptidoglycan/LPS O-acetylase OafA/YrhL
MEKKEVSHLAYLDGLRALAAFYVVLFHAGVCFTTGDLSLLGRNARRCLSFGHDAVAVFIVLSGYCLMIPAARRDGHVSGGFRGYLARRAWRILPPYYAALLCSLVIVVAFPGLAVKTGTIWDDTYPALAWGPIATHLVVVHNLFPAWIHTINGPLWSVATEWQIYFFFPLFLLPLWRRFGPLVTILGGSALGALGQVLAPRIAAVSAPWYLGLFAFGMCASGVGFSSRPAEQALRERLPWARVCLALSVVTLLSATVFAKAWFRHMPLSDALVGATTATALVHYTKCAAVAGAAPRPFALRLLESRPLVFLGRFSYSLYLSHLPVVALCYFALRALPLSPGAQMAAMLATAVPLSLLVAYGFFLGVERHFLARRAPVTKGSNLKVPSS